MTMNELQIKTIASKQSDRKERMVFYRTVDPSEELHEVAADLHGGPNGDGPKQERIEEAMVLLQTY